MNLIQVLYADTPPPEVRLITLQYLSIKEVQQWTQRAVFGEPKMSAHVEDRKGVGWGVYMREIKPQLQKCEGRGAS